MFIVWQSFTDNRFALVPGLQDFLAQADGQAVSSGNVGHRIVLPSSHTGGPRQMVQRYQDAMAIVRERGPPTLFITFTCNPDWPDIKQAMPIRRNGEYLTPAECPDIVCRVFMMKFAECRRLMFDMGIFGNVVGRVWVVEFQKRGLPHAHMLLILDEDSKPVEPADFDRFICAEIPDPRHDPKLFETVTRSMMHGPCGTANPNAPCMVDGRCSKGYPKPFQEETTLDEATGYPLYRRRNNAVTIEVGGHVLDNRWVVPYNPVLLKLFDAHINVEICASPSGIKNLFKYIHKESDRAQVAIAQGADAPGQNVQPEAVDEIKRYLNARYITPHEACWRILYYPLHQEWPPVVRLQVHLEGEQMVTFNENDDLQYIIDTAANKDTTLTAWFKANEKYPWANQYTYVEFPKYFVWKQETQEWKPRTKGMAVARIYYVPHIIKERFYLRMLLNIHCAWRQGFSGYDDS